MIMLRGIANPVHVGKSLLLISALGLDLAIQPSITVGPDEPLNTKDTRGTKVCSFVYGACPAKSSQREPVEGCP